MPLAPATRLGSYEIIAPIGAGGMGEVYRARDTKLQRDVAIKVLPDLFAADPDRLARFEREAQTLAALNHPNIAQIHGVQEEPDETGRPVRALVMEFVDGEDLSARLARGAVPVDEALAIARQMAEALEAAHEQGVIHRDLKPANIKVTPDGTVKVLDFGLAKALDPIDIGVASPAAPGREAMNSPTFTSPVMTQMGVILGTAAYMAPEQAKGKRLDRRVDIWAFGVVLYELLTGRQLFAGETIAETIGLVVTREPDLSLLPADTPARVRELLRRCLERDPKQRLRDAGEARIALASAGASDISAPPVGGRLRRHRPLVEAAAVVMALLAGVGIGFLLFSRAAGTAAPEFAFEIGVPGQQIVAGSLALSPDGSQIAFRLVLPDGSSEIWVRSMSEPEPRRLPGTTDLDASRPFWSPDGRHVGFFLARDLWRIAADGTASRRLATAPSEPRGGAWGADDVILFGTEGGAIFRTSATGGSEPAPVTTVESPIEEMHVWPAFLPDGRQFVFLADGTSDEAHRVRLASLVDGKSRILRKGIRSSPAIDPRGALVIAERGQLVAYRLDFGTGTLGHESSLMADGVFPLGDRHILPASVSGGGMLAYQRASGGVNLVRVSLEEGGEQVLLSGERFANAVVSPDGRHIAFEALADASAARLIWIHDLERGVQTLASERDGVSDSPTWSARGDIVYFNSRMDGSWKVHRKQANGSGNPEIVGAPPNSLDVGVQHCSPDGKYLLASSQTGAGNWDLYLLPLDTPDATWKPWLATPAVERFGRFSPDSRWIAYTSTTSGRSEVYVSALDDPSRRWQISSSGANMPVWAPDGRRLYYRSPTDELMSVDLDMSGGEVRSKAPQALLNLLSASDVNARNVFDVLPDGRSLVAVRRLADEQVTIQVRTGVPLPR